MPKYRSSRPEVFCRRGILRNFAKFTGKNLCQSLFFNKVADLRPATLLREILWYRCFPVNFVKFLRTLFHRGPLVDDFGNRVFSIKMRGFEIAKDPEEYSESCQTSKMEILEGDLTAERR